MTFLQPYYDHAELMNSRPTPVPVPAPPSGWLAVFLGWWKR